MSWFLTGEAIEGQEVSEEDLLGKDILAEECEEVMPEENSDEDKEDKKRPLKEEGDRTKKKSKKDDGSEGTKTDSNKADGVKDKKTSNMRRNIREVMDETQLDEATLAAQRQEIERLRRLQEQQRIMREVSFSHDLDNKIYLIFICVMGCPSLYRWVLPDVKDKFVLDIKCFLQILTIYLYNKILL